MAISDVDICNIALRRIGVKVSITSLADPTPEAQACAIAYPHVYGLFVQAARWPTLTITVAVTNAGAVASAELPKWTYRWSWSSWTPPLIICDVYTQDGASIPHELRRNPTDPIDMYLLTNEPTYWFEYVSVEPSQASLDWFTTAMADAVAWGIASELALYLPVRPDLEQLCRARYDRAVNEALARDLRNTREYPVRDADHIRVRS